MFSKNLDKDNVRFYEDFWSDDDDHNAEDNGNKNLRGHENEKKNAAAIESEDDSTRSEFPVCFD